MGKRTTGEREVRQWRRWTEERAREALEELEASGESAVSFAERKGVSAQRIAYWKRRLAGPSKTEFVAVALPSASRGLMEIRVATHPPLSPFSIPGKYAISQQVMRGTRLAMPLGHGSSCARRARGARRFSPRRVSSPRAARNGSLSDGGRNARAPTTRRWDAGNRGRC